MSNRVPMRCRCPQGHEWRTTMNNFQFGKRCPSCVRTHGLTMGYAEAVAPILEAEYTVLGGEFEYENTHSRVRVRCPEGHAPYDVQVYNFRNGRRCPGCACHSSVGERELLEFMTTLDPGVVSSRLVLEGLEVDAYSRVHGLGVEYHGLYWHSEASGKSRSYHHDKAEAAAKAGIRLLQFFEDEWRDRQALVRTLVSKTMGVRPRRRVYARACEVREVLPGDRRGFLEVNHLQGDAAASWCWGLYVGDDLLQVLSVREARYTGAPSSFWEVARFATRVDTQVVGGLSRLLSRAREYLRARGVTRLYTFADRRYSDGQAYKAVGFRLLGTTPPGYFYTDFHVRRHRYAMRKDRGCPPGVTERQYRASQGWHRIWDAGQLKFVLDLDNNGGDDRAP